VYEIGAVRALQEALEGIDFNDVDTYVGVSAGAFVAACLANGLTPSQLVRALVKHEPGEHPFMPETFFRPASREIVGRVAMVPGLVGAAVLQHVREPRDQTLVESLTLLARALPVGVFDSEPMRRYLERIFSLPGRTDDFRKLRRRLVIIAADLEAGRALRFGERGHDDVPISVAVQASTALPGVYPPVEIGGRYCVDGTLLKTVHASVPLEHGAELVLCVNPIVPVDLTRAARRKLLAPGTLVRLGLPAVISQTIRTMIHSRFDVGVASYAGRYPKADIVIFEPRRDEYRMFFSNIFSFSSRREVCELAYEGTREDLRQRYDELSPILARHGVRIRRDVLEDRTLNVWTGVGLSESGCGSSVANSLRSVLAKLSTMEATSSS
jgi:NTE family protein